MTPTETTEAIARIEAIEKRLDTYEDWEQKYNLLEATTRILISSILRSSALNVVGIGESIIKPLNQCETIMLANRGIK